MLYSKCDWILSTRGKEIRMKYKDKLSRIYDFTHRKWNSVAGSNTVANQCVIFYKYSVQ